MSKGAAIKFALETVRPKTVLEVGCGPTAESDTPHRQLILGSGARYIGIDRNGKESGSPAENQQFFVRTLPDCELPTADMVVTFGILCYPAGADGSVEQFTHWVDRIRTTAPYWCFYDSFPVLWDDKTIDDYIHTQGDVLKLEKADPGRDPHYVRWGLVRFT